MDDPFGTRYAAVFLVSSLDNSIGELSMHIHGAVTKAHEALGDTAWIERISTETTMFGEHYRVIFKPTDRSHHPLELEHVVWEMCKTRPHFDEVAYGRRHRDQRS